MSKKNEFDFLESESKGIFEKVNKVEIDPPAFLRTRIIASIKSKESAHSRTIFWKKFAIMSSSLVVVLVLFILFALSNRDIVFNASTIAPVLVKVDISEVKDSAYAYARIDVPNGVSFYSGTFKEIAQHNFLYVSREDMKTGQLPFVVIASQKGQRTVTVTFYDDKDKTVFVKKIKINFVNNARKGV